MRLPLMPKLQFKRMVRNCWGNSKQSLEATASGLLFCLLNSIRGVATLWRNLLRYRAMFSKKTRTVGARQLYVTWFDVRSKMRCTQFAGGSQEKSKSRDLLFSIQSEGLACNLTAGEYVIAAGVWHHAQRVSFLRIDYIQHFVLIPYRRQAADFIHAYRRDYIESYVKVLDFWGLFVFLVVKTPPFHSHTFFLPLYRALYIEKHKKYVIMVINKV